MKVRQVHRTQSSVRANSGNSDLVQNRMERTFSKSWFLEKKFITKHPRSEPFLCGQSGLGRPSDKHGRSNPHNAFRSVNEILSIYYYDDQTWLPAVWNPIKVPLLRRNCSDSSRLAPNPYIFLLNASTPIIFARFFKSHIIDFVYSLAVLSWFLFVLYDVTALKIKNWSTRYKLFNYWRGN